MNLLEFVEFEEQIGRIWHRLIGTGSVTAGYHHYPDAAVSLEDIRVALGVFFGDWAARLALLSPLEHNEHLDIV